MPCSIFQPACIGFSTMFTTVFEVNSTLYRWWEGTWSCSLLRVTSHRAWFPRRSRMLADVFSCRIFMEHLAVLVVDRSFSSLADRGGYWSKVWSWKELCMRMHPKRNYFLCAMIKEVQSRSDKLIYILKLSKNTYKINFLKNYILRKIRFNLMPNKYFMIFYTTIMYWLVLLFDMVCINLSSWWACMWALADWSLLILNCNFWEAMLARESLDERWN